MRGRAAACPREAAHRPGGQFMAYITEQNLTDVVLKRWQGIPDPRLKEIMQSLIKHMHDFVRDIEPTGEEWFKAIDWITRTGKMSDNKRQEVILFSDVMGVSMLVDAINNRLDTGATPTTVEGPFHVADAPEMANGANMAKGAPGIPTFVTGKVQSLDGKAVANAELDLWQTDGEGLYESQKGIDEPWMRGIFRSQADGSYSLRTVAPIAYTIPMDGTVGELMAKTKISHMRPAHIHFAVSAPGYHKVTTHLFQKGDKYIATDVVYGVKEPLIVEFTKKSGGKAPNGETIDGPFYVVHYDFVLQKQAKAQAA
jgi:hydroxyquinol 1,2-dioxygenase